MSLYQIDKLDEKNYDAWCIHMKSVLIHSGLWNIVSEKDTQPSAKEAAEKWVELDEKALATITLCIHASQLNHIKNCKTSAEAWKSLREVFRPSGPVKKVYLYKQLLNTRMAEDGNMSEHINNFSGIVDKLAEVGINLNEELVTIILLSSLPGQYEQFVVAMEARDTLPSLQNLKVKLLEESERKTQKEGERAQQSAYAAKAKTQNYENYKKQQQFNKRCERQNKKKSTVCFVCGKQGHFAANCYSKKRPESRKEHAQFTVLAAADANTLHNDIWCVDSGATAHMSGDRSCFSTMREHSERITLAAENYIQAEGIGDVSIVTAEGDLLLRNVLYVPNLVGNFVSVSRAVDNGIRVTFNNAVAKFIDRNNECILQAKKRNNLFVFEAEIEKRNQQLCQMRSSNDIIWHNRYGHLNFESLRELQQNKMVHGLNQVRFKGNVSCLTCMKTKIHVKPFKHNNVIISKNVLDLIHTDVCGPFNTQSLGGSRYFITFIDDYSRRIFVYFLKTKDEAFEKFVSFQNMVELQTERKIKCLRSDNGGEFVNKQFDEHLNKCGIKRQLTVPYTPQQNGVAERFNRTLIEMARSMLVHSGMNENLWAEAVSTAAYLRNRAPTKLIANKTPIEVFSGFKPSVSHLKVFGSIAVALDKTQRKKFQTKGKVYKMVGYSLISKAYRLFDPETKNVVERRDVYFDEYAEKGNMCEATEKSNEATNNNCIDVSKFLINLNKEGSTATDSYLENNSGNSEEDEENIESQQSDEAEYESVEEMPSEDEQQQRVGPGRPKLERTGKPGRPRKAFNMVNSMQEVTKIDIPNSVTEALNSKYKSEWKIAMQNEYDSLLKNKTWMLVELPDRQKAIGSKWVFNVKRNKDGSVEKFKARLVAKGCAQKYGVDYKETFSPVVRYATIRMLLALAVEHDLYLEQMDVCTAYLNGKLRDTVYMQQPECFVDERYPEHVLKLNKAIYGLKQAGREWNIKLDEVLRSIGFTSLESEKCLYKFNDNNKISFIAVYVDDIIIASKSKEEIFKIKSEISNHFNCVDKGQLSYFLGIEIERKGELGEISISQKNYIENLLKENNMENCRSVSTPLDACFQVKCDDEKCKRVNANEYQSLIGSLMYLALSTRPDILHSVAKLAQRNTNPHHEHLSGVKHILRYLSATKGLKITYRKTGQPIVGYVDADWGSNSFDRKSYTGYAFFMGGSVFSWESSKQRTVALSSTEAEFVALSVAAKETIYLQKLLKEIGLTSSNEPIVVYGDNLSAQQIVKNHTYHSRTKHIDIKYNFIRDVVKDNLLKIEYIPTNEMIADVLTKNLVKVKHCNFVNKLGLK